jgi:hypothetical protein
MLNILICIEKKVVWILEVGDMRELDCQQWKELEICWMKL